MPQKRQLVSVDPTNLDMLFFRTAVAALFRAKAELILVSLPPTERIVHRQCEIDSDGRLNLLAKCLVSLLNMRDFAANSNSDLKSLNAAELPLIETLSEQLFKTKLIVEKEKHQKENGIKKNPKKLLDLLSLSQKLLTNSKKVKAWTRGNRVMLNINNKRGAQSSNEFHVDEKVLKTYPNVQKLIRIERFYRSVEKCNKYIRRKDEQHSKFFQSAGMPFRLYTKSAERSPLLELVESQLKGTVRFDKLSVLSPKVLSILPERVNTLKRPIQDNMTVPNSLNLLLSPTFLSFHEHGFFSLPYLLKLGLSNGNETLGWLDLLLQLSGASKTLDKLMKSLEPTFEEVQRQILPTILRLEELEERFRRLEIAQSRRQRDEMDSRGFTFLTGEQSRIILGSENFDEFGEDGVDDIEAVLEEDIRMIARTSDAEVSNISNLIDQRPNAPNGRREKRFLRTEPYGTVRLLNPYLFANQLHDGAVLRRVALSPKAFAAELLSPDFARLDLLSPGAFVPSILSPRAMIAHILSPTAFSARILSPQSHLAEVLNPRVFDAKILSPRALVALVLSPRMLITEILTPKALELRVLSPSVLAFNLLSPNLLGAQFASPQFFVTTVLSPNILSPQFLNEGFGNVQKESNN
uniref:Uncharacterized protein n=1 Tax=Globodera rostochiensis TaxID=31243 RepID=A0A914HSD8_GLORO